MRTIKRILGITALLAAIGLLAFACSDDLDIRQTYLFDLVSMPVQKRIKQGDTAEIRCQIIREGNFDDARYYIRYFQPDGKGELRLDDGTLFAPNDLYPLDRMAFRLYYTSHSTDQQTINVFIQDDVGQLIQKDFSFQNEREEEPHEE